MKTLFFLIMSQAFISFSAMSQSKQQIIDLQEENIPERQSYAPNGTEFAKSIRYLEGADREKAILDQILSGNLPDFQRNLVPVKVSSFIPGKGKVTLTYYTTPDYLAVGSDEDFIRVPVNYYSAQLIAQSFNFVLPTRKMVDQIYASSAIKLKPSPMSPGPRMTSTGYFVNHDDKIEDQLSQKQEFLGQLVAGHKKDVVQSNRLVKKPDAIAIYGWHRKSGDPIQPLSTVHGAYYADYSHGIRLISNWAVIENGRSKELVSMSDVLNSPFWSLVSDEGRIKPSTYTYVSN